MHFLEKRHSIALFSKLFSENNMLNATTENFVSYIFRYYFFINERTILGNVFLFSLMLLLSIFLSPPVSSFVLTGT